MIKKTKDYDLFVFRDDNREKIDKAHVLKLIESIKSRNLLELRPICVNANMEIVDGQHRLLAAKTLGVDIYYQQDKSLDASDIIRMNISKPWTIGDYLNFYCEQGYDEYIKIKRFVEKHNLSLKVALNIIMGNQKNNFLQFKNGQFTFMQEEIDQQIQVCWDTIGYIKKMNGYSAYTNSSRFWKALLRIVNHPEFNEEKWLSNTRKMIEHFTVKAKFEDYLATFSTVYNYRSPAKVNFMD